ncbi:MAG: hypothetical protein IPI23_16155 [Bacteroidetes bacterium]|nr:hypothetical protein [Bacteroidota bacterium]
MKKYLILYYSKTGNCKFVAEKLCREFSCDIEMIKPGINNTGILFLLSLMNISVPVNTSASTIGKYDEIILIGPVWGGLLIAPLKSILKMCIRQTKVIHFAVTCESKESDKNGKYGYNTVLNKFKEVADKMIGATAAFSTSLITGYNEKDYSIKVKPKFTNANFGEELLKRLNIFRQSITGINSDVE